MVHMKIEFMVGTKIFSFQYPPLNETEGNAFMISPTKWGTLDERNGIIELKNLKEKLREEGSFNSFYVMMNNKMKGLLKGLRYISQIFEEEEEEKEKEMEIGYPTDVKHVAHFGCDGPANAPTWMGEYQFTPNNTHRKGLEAPNKEISRLSINPTDPEPLPPSPAKRPHRRRSSASDSPLASDSHSGRDKDSSNREKRHSRRHQSAGDSPSMDPSDGAFRRSRRHSKLSASASESPGRDAPSVPTQSRRRKSKGESGSSASVAVGIP